MITIVKRRVGCKSTPQPLILGRVLEELEITTFASESVAQYKREKLDQVEAELRPADAEEIEEYDFGEWEYFELQWLHDRIAVDGVTGDEPVIHFWRTRRDQRFYTFFQWVKRPLENTIDVPEFVQAKAAQIASNLPEATFTVEELRSERRAYDPFLIVSYGDESYYIEVWDESEFEGRYT